MLFLEMKSTANVFWHQSRLTPMSVHVRLIFHVSSYLSVVLIYVAFFLHHIRNRDNINVFDLFYH